MEDQIQPAPQPEEQSSSQQKEEERLPHDFASRIATKVIFSGERERDPEVALEKIGKMLLRNLSPPGRAGYFLDMIDALENDPETARFAGLAWVSLVLDKGDDHRFEKFVSDVLDTVIQGHLSSDREDIELEYRRKRFSFYARNMGEAFIAMMNINSDLYETISEIFSTMIKKEMALETQKKSNEPASRRISVSKKDEEKKVGKKLFDDVVDYVHARGEQRTGTLHQTNPNEYISVLADRMRGTRRYVIQDLLNRQAMQRRKEAQKELSEKLAGAEEIMRARDTFKKGIHLYWTEKQYNFKYMAVEKVRVAVQIMSVILGILYFLMGYIGMIGMQWWEGIIITIAMFMFSKYFCSRNFFKNFFPEDVSKELEVVVGSFTPTMRKMSQDQLDAFFLRQVKDQENDKFLLILGEFVRYVFAVMPERGTTVVGKDELGDIIQNMEMDIARALRASGGHTTSGYG